jgi:hypothetical protein
MELRLRRRLFLSFFYKDYKYDKLSDALNYAKIDESRNR